MGSAPFLGGRFGHFYVYAPAKFEYSINRYAMEVKRQLDVLDRQLAEHRFLVGDDDTIADMAVWPWYGSLVEGRLYEVAEFLSVQRVQACAALDQRDCTATGRAAWAQGQPCLG